MSDDTKTLMVAGKERLLCYSGAILCQLLDNHGTTEVQDWMYERAVKAAQTLIDTVYKR